ncbi:MULTISPECIES: Hsp20/alpha crystallin family protein [Achromobacter]|uniref:Hsp20/alpha crystallin family protein n=1 Tax=Alcaligenes xylosoxydans xylosoxydans TaxID=85698 RepID=A0A424W7D4_ALCXX|nr:MULTISPECIES: Hsp20/alpha crystallin family protein [Achromobacter]MBC9907006.1 Hsp20/alpha crystallin family protein [Achromobacter xylosoxidans]MBD0871673.1 Hsp20/alpha crystallin family protein [Achromobacter xylosoxidans]MDH1300474.1 Hsp20/alpha crystallin family protein [Achromobacter sp. GD03932]QNP87581.1 Hsp20/alpha crystallin family protein [Achromobacter xylosoxidans]RPJ89193.1 Hsp20/alpha crystallin family protein [Achromobacter xylosoxidans]
MSRLTQYSPFMSEPLSDVFQAFLRPIRQNLDEQTPRMDIDVTEAGDKYVLKAEVPGIDKKDISVEIDGNTVMISANKEKSSETKEAGNVVRQERFWGRIQRSVSLASPIDQAAAKAVCENGVLILTLPKAAGSRNKTLQIE